MLQPKPVSRPRPVIYAGGESEAAKNLISQKCDAYVMHGDPPEKIREKIRDLSARRKQWGLPRMQFGIAAYAIVRETEKEAQDEVRRITDVKQNAAGYQNYQQWLAEYPTGAARFAGRLFGLQPRAALGPGRYRGTGSGTHF